MRLPAITNMSALPAACRLTDIKANSKFSSPYATAEDVSSVSSGFCPTPSRLVQAGLAGWLKRRQVQGWLIGLLVMLSVTAAVQAASRNSTFLPACYNTCLQGRKEDLRSVVEHLRKRYNVQYVYCWHGECELRTAAGASRAGTGSKALPVAGRDRLLISCASSWHRGSTPRAPAVLCAGLSAYWSGVSPTAPAVQKYEPRLFFPKPTPGLSEIEPRCVKGLGVWSVWGWLRVGLIAWLQCAALPAHPVTQPVANNMLCNPSRLPPLLRCPAVRLQHGVEPGNTGGHCCASEA
jgi:hypothetical protein